MHYATPRGSDVYVSENQSTRGTSVIGGSGRSTALGRDGRGLHGFYQGIVVVVQREGQIENIKVKGQVLGWDVVGGKTHH